MEEEEEVLAGSKTVNSTRSCLPEWWAEHHVNTCRPSLLLPSLLLVPSSVGIPTLDIAVLSLDCSSG